MKETVGVIIDPADILEIHRIPGKHGKIRPVIAKFKNTEAKVNLIKHRSKQEVKKNFIMFDHIYYSTKFTTSSAIKQRPANSKSLVFQRENVCAGPLRSSTQIRFTGFGGHEAKKTSKSDIEGATIRSGSRTRNS